jgi:predicted alpha/beta superfamily hydrolase
LYLLIATLATAVAHGQNPVVVGESLSFRSAVLGEDRQLFISKPAEYDGAQERYPVLYILDGETHFRYASGIVEFLASADRIPELIVIGIGSGSRERRTRDLTPVSTSEMDRRFHPVHGGAANFLSFLIQELMPMVDKKYRTRPYRILVGHSLGGLFAAHAFSEKTAAFQAYIAIDPSLSWNNGAVVDQIAGMLNRTKLLRTDFFLTATHSGDQMDRSVRKLADVLKEKASPGFRSHFEWMNQETHMSIPLRGLHQGLETVFDGWHLTNPLELFEKGGIQAVHTHFREGGERCGYVRTTSPFMVSMIVAELIWKGRLDEASRLLVHDEKAYPAPWNQLDALARAYGDRGNQERAIHFYKESLKANPQNEWAKRKLREMGADPDQNSNRQRP